MTDEENHNFVPDDLRNYKVARTGNLVINKMKAWQGSLGIAPLDGIVSPAYYVFDFKIADKRFGQLLLRSKPYVSFFGRASDGVRIGQWNLSIDQMKRIPVAVPPLPEQAAIVRFLDHADRRIQRYIRAKKKLIALLNEQKQAIIHHAVTRGLDPNVRLKPSGVEWLGEVPEHWEFRRVKQVCTSIVDCKNRTPDMVQSGTFTVVRTTNIRNGSFNLDGSYPTNRQNYETWTARGAPRLGDVFFTREAPSGEACLVPDVDNLCMGQRMMYFRPDPAMLDARFLLYSIYGPLARGYIEQATNGSTVGHLRLGQVSAMPLLWCSVEEQRSIVKSLEAAHAALNETFDRTEQEIKLVREYRARLIADVVTGKLDVREAAANLPDDELAAEPFDDLVALEETDEDAEEADLEAEALPA
jgi:type I restriction enzyme, S subunit